MLQLGPTATARHAEHTKYVRLALALPPDSQPDPDAVATFVSKLSAAWRLKWENVEKETLWRLAVDGVPGANGRVKFKCCGCPAVDLPEDARLHFFWDCPVAVAVRATIATALGPTPASAASRPSVWLCRAPDCIHHGVWLVVCMAALSAMNHGRRQLWRLTKAAEARLSAAMAAARKAAARRRQHTLLEMKGFALRVNPRPLIARASALAVADFWGRLASFAALGRVPAAWHSQVGACHPFLCNGGLVVNMGAARSLLRGAAGGLSWGGRDGDEDAWGEHSVPADDSLSPAARLQVIPAVRHVDPATPPGAYLVHPRRQLTLLEAWATTAA